MLTLIAINGPSKGQVLRIAPGEPALIGRQAPRYKLADSRVSRRHAEVQLDGGRWVLRDLNSSNGTFVNGHRINRPTVLSEGDQVQIGRLLLVVGHAAADAPATAPAEPVASEESADASSDTMLGGFSFMDAIAEEMAQHDETGEGGALLAAEPSDSPADDAGEQTQASTTDSAARPSRPERPELPVSTATAPSSAAAGSDDAPRPPAGHQTPTRPAAPSREQPTHLIEELLRSHAIDPADGDAPDATNKGRVAERSGTGHRPVNPLASREDAERRHAPSVERPSTPPSRIDASADADAEADRAAREPHGTDGAGGDGRVAHRGESVESGESRDAARPGDAPDTGDAVEIPFPPPEPSLSDSVTGEAFDPERELRALSEAAASVSGGGGYGAWDRPEDAAKAPAARQGAAGTSTGEDRSPGRRFASSEPEASESPILSDWSGRSSGRRRVAAAVAVLVLAAGGVGAWYLTASGGGGGWAALREMIWPNEVKLATGSAENQPAPESEASAVDRAPTTRVDPANGASAAERADSGATATLSKGSPAAPSDGDGGGELASEAVAAAERLDDGPSTGQSDAGAATPEVESSEDLALGALSAGPRLGRPRGESDRPIDSRAGAGPETASDSQADAESAPAGETGGEPSAVAPRPGRAEVVSPEAEVTEPASAVDDSAAEGRAASADGSAPSYDPGSALDEVFRSLDALVDSDRGQRDARVVEAGSAPSVAEEEEAGPNESADTGEMAETDPSEPDAAEPRPGDAGSTTAAIDEAVSVGEADATPSALSVPAASSAPSDAARAEGDSDSPAPPPSRPFTQAPVEADEAVAFATPVELNGESGADAEAERVGASPGATVTEAGEAELAAAIEPELSTSISESSPQPREAATSSTPPAEPEPQASVPAFRGGGPGDAAVAVADPEEETVTVPATATEDASDAATDAGSEAATEAAGASGSDAEPAQPVETARLARAEPSTPDPTRSPRETERSQPRSGEASPARQGAAVPRTSPPADATRSSHVAYLVDASGSLLDTMPQLLEWLASSIDSLDADTRFTVVFFRRGEAIEVPPTGLKPSDAEHKRRVRAWIDPGRGHVVPAGRSDPFVALDRVLAYHTGEIYLLTDDSVGRRFERPDAERFLERFAERIGDRPVRVHGVQFFYQDPQQVLRKLAAQHDGTFQFIESQRPVGPDPFELLQGYSSQLP